MTTPELMPLMIRDPEHPTVRRLLLRHRERLLAELRDTEELLRIPLSVPPKRARPYEPDTQPQS